MTPERWAHITEVFEAALEKKPDEGQVFWGKCAARMRFCAGTWSDCWHSRRIRG